MTLPFVIRHSKFVISPALPFVIQDSSFGILPERLTPATLAKAFRGELVPQDPNDEPASALLARFSSQPPAKSPEAKRAKRS